MVFRFSIDGVWFGNFPDRQSIHIYLSKNKWIQTTEDSDVYYKRVLGRLTGTGEVVQTPEVRDASDMPKS